MNLTAVFVFMMLFVMVFGHNISDQNLNYIKWGDKSIDKKKPEEMIQTVCGNQLNLACILGLVTELAGDQTTGALEGYTPGKDYPAYEEVPKGLTFTCDDKIPGYYANPETRCQVWHWCAPVMHGNAMYTFMCNAGTVFNQMTRTCDWFFVVDCPNSPDHYAINQDLYKDEDGNYITKKPK